MRALIDKLTDLDCPLYKNAVRVAKPVVAVVAIGFVLFAYLANIAIDQASEKLYFALDAVFYVFAALSVPAAVVAAVLIAAARARSREYYAFRNRSRLNKHVHIFDVINAVLLGAFCLLCIFPILYVLAGSFNQGADYLKGDVYLIPRTFTFENYKVVLQNVGLWKSYGITIARTVIGTVTALVFTAAVAYAMSRPNLRFKPVFYWINLFTMFFGGGLIPYFLVIKTIGLYDNFLVYIIPGLYSVYNMIVIQSGFKALSGEIHDAAYIDGAGELRIWWTIYMPLTKPILATVALWIAVGHWNSYFDSLIYTHDEDLQTLQSFLLRTIQTSSLQSGLPESMLERLSAKTISLAAIIVSIVPVLFFFPFIRKNFSTGIMVGSLKG